MSSQRPRQIVELTRVRLLEFLREPEIIFWVFGFPVDRCAKILLTEVYRYLQGGTKIERVVISLWGDETFEVFKRELRRGFR